MLADNARDAAQVRPLLPAPDCLLLVTSQTRFTLPGLKAIDLDCLAVGPGNMNFHRPAVPAPIPPNGARLVRCYGWQRSLDLQGRNPEGLSHKAIRTIMHLFRCSMF